VCGQRKLRIGGNPVAIVFSGIQPSGAVHIGNYLGAIRNWVRLLPMHDCIFCIVDYHAATIEYNPRDLPAMIIDAAVDNMAAGLDPEKCTLFVQSDVPEHTELTWILNTVIPVVYLQRMTQYKEKAKQHAKNINMALLDYPVLQAADILLYKATLVPVGEDQLQHIELSREIARRFNKRFGDTFPEPHAELSPAPRILGLDGDAKMSKSLGNHIALRDEPTVIRNKLATAMTDPARKRRSDSGNPEICNIYTLHKQYSSAHEQGEVAQGCTTASIGCLDCKGVLATNIIRDLEPIQARIKELSENPEAVRDALRQGADRCRGIARTTMEEVRAAMGIRAWDR
jgi:tryptophanyl-tRNA synthetase